MTDQISLQQDNSTTEGLFDLAAYIGLSSDEKRAATYAAALDSAAVIQTPAPTDLIDYSEDHWKQRIKANVDHLEGLLKETYWKNEDLTPLRDAVVAGKAILA